MSTTYREPEAKFPEVGVEEKELPTATDNAEAVETVSLPSV